MLKPQRLTFADVAPEVERLGRSEATHAETEATVRAILKDVRTRGYAAVRAYSERFDGVGNSESVIRVPQAALDTALTTLTRDEPELVQALRTMIRNVRTFAAAERAALQDIEVPLPAGGSVGQRWVPISTVGVYVPGGRAFYPSTLAMTVVPAQVAGVSRIIAITPPRAEGPDVRVLATARLLGLTELLTIGGAHGIGYLAYGEPQVDLVAGPGNRFVAEAKRQLLGRCGIDSVAGPTELLVIADSAADPGAIAEDMLAQAEHDPDAAAVCIADEMGWLDRLASELTERAANSPRRDVVQSSLARHGRLYCADVETTVAFGEAWAPEHLQIVVLDPSTYEIGRAHV